MEAQPPHSLAAVAPHSLTTAVAPHSLAVVAAHFSTAAVASPRSLSQLPPPSLFECNMDFEKIVECSQLEKKQKALDIRNHAPQNEILQSLRL